MNWEYEIGIILKWGSAWLAVSIVCAVIYSQCATLDDRREK